MKSVSWVLALILAQATPPPVPHDKPFEVPLNPPKLPQSCQQLRIEDNKCENDLKSCDQRLVERLRLRCAQDARRTGGRGKKASVGKLKASYPSAAAAASISCSPGRGSRVLIGRHPRFRLQIELQLPRIAPFRYGADGTVWRPDNDLHIGAQSPGLRGQPLDLLARAGARREQHDALAHDRKVPSHSGAPGYFFRKPTAAQHTAAPMIRTANGTTGTLNTLNAHSRCARTLCSQLFGSQCRAVLMPMNQTIKSTIDSRSNPRRRFIPLTPFS